MGLPRAVELDRGGAGEVHLGLERHRVRTSSGGAARVLVVARRPQRRIQAFENALCVCVPSVCVRSWLYLSEFGSSVRIREQRFGRYAQIVFYKETPDPIAAASWRHTSSSWRRISRARCVRATRPARSSRSRSRAPSREVSLARTRARERPPSSVFAREGFRARRLDRSIARRAKARGTRNDGDDNAAVVDVSAVKSRARRALD